MKRRNWDAKLHHFVSSKCSGSSSRSTWPRPHAGALAAMATRSRSAQPQAHPRLVPGAPPSLWPRLPAELLARIASACECGTALRAIDAVDGSLWSTRVERLLGALQGSPSEPLLLHVRHVARRAAPALVTAGACYNPDSRHQLTAPRPRLTSHSAPPAPHPLTPPHRALAAGVVPVLIQCIADGEALPAGGLPTAGLQAGGLQTGGLQAGGLQTGGLPTGGLQTAFGSVTALLDAAKAPNPNPSRSPNPGPSPCPSPSP